MIQKEPNLGLIFNERYNKIFAEMLHCDENLRKKLRNWFKPFKHSFDESILNEIEVDCDMKMPRSSFFVNGYGESLDIDIDFDEEGKDSMFVEFRKKCHMMPDETLIFLIVPVSKEVVLPKFKEETALEDLTNRLLVGEQGSVYFNNIEIYNDEELPVAKEGYCFDLISTENSTKLGCRNFNETTKEGKTSLTDVDLNDFLVIDETALNA